MAGGFEIRLFVFGKNGEIFGLRPAGRYYYVPFIPDVLLTCPF